MKEKKTVIKVKVYSVEYLGFMPIEDVDENTRYDCGSSVFPIPFGEYPNEQSVIGEIKKQLDLFYESSKLEEEKYIFDFKDTKYDETGILKSMQILNNGKLKQIHEQEVEEIKGNALSSLELDMERLYSNIFLIQVDSEIE